MKKITKTTFKSFVKKNEGKLFIQVQSDFDPMVDCVMPNNDKAFKKLEKKEGTTYQLDHDLGYNGIWLVGSSRDWFEAYEDDNFIGYEYYNCCGSALVVIKK